MYLNFYGLYDGCRDKKQIDFVYFNTGNIRR